MLYSPAAFFVRATILLLIARVFAARRYAAMALHLYIWVLLISVIPLQVMKIMICLPIHAFWDKNVPHAICMDQRKIFVVERSIAIISDGLILIAPVTLSWSLDISLQKKLKIASLLGAGGIAIGITGYQMTKLVGFQTSTDPTADMVVLDITT
jgi:prepilin signal peptidase PulO-like enzyme (type II secretory pathway)